MKKMLPLLVFAAFLTATPAHAAQKVLVVLSEASQIPTKDGPSYEIGFYLNELTVPVKKLVDAGYEPVFATPSGNAPHLDAASDDARFFGDNEAVHQEYKAFLASLHLDAKNPSPVKSLKSLEKSDFSDYAALLVPGGHAPMVDLIQNTSLGKILHTFHARNTPTGLICHGPVALVSAVSDPKAFVDAVKAGDKDKIKQLSKDWIYDGYSMTVFSTVEETGAETRKFGGHQLTIRPEDALSNAGGKMSEGEAGKSHTVQFRELLTGQNPFSDAEFADKFVALIKAGPSKSTPPEAHR